MGIKGKVLCFRLLGCDCVWWGWGFQRYLTSLVEGETAPWEDGPGFSQPSGAVPGCALCQAAETPQQGAGRYCLGMGWLRSRPGCPELGHGLCIL